MAPKTTRRQFQRAAAAQVAPMTDEQRLTLIQENGFGPMIVTFKSNYMEVVQALLEENCPWYQARVPHLSSVSAKDHQAILVFPTETYHREIAGWAAGALVCDLIYGFYLER